MNNNQTVIPSVKAKITWMIDDTSAPKKASASITIGNSFMVNGLSIVQGQKGLFVSMPQRVSEKDGQKKYIEVAHPINSEMRTAPSQKRNVTSKTVMKSCRRNSPSMRTG